LRKATGDLAHLITLSPHLIVAMAKLWQHICQVIIKLWGHFIAKGKRQKARVKPLLLLGFKD
jgi:hypothetical protein